MSTSRINVTSDDLFVRAKNTHYMVSTFAAVVYALVWMLSNGVHAETSAANAEHAVLPAIVVTATYPDVLPALVVVGTRDASMSIATLDAIVVTGKQVARVANAGYNSPATNNGRVNYVSKVRSWVRSTLAKVSG
jgi:hypothetical protein